MSLCTAPAPCHALSVSGASHLWVYMSCAYWVTSSDLQTSNICPVKCFQLRGGKQTGRSPAGVRLSCIYHALSRSGSATQPSYTDRQDNICLPHEKGFIFVCTSKYATCFVDWSGAKKKNIRRGSKSFFFFVTVWVTLTDGESRRKH